MYIYPREADYKCVKGHEFVSNPDHHKGSSPICPTCHAEFIAANVPIGVQVGETRVITETKGMLLGTDTRFALQ